MPLLKIPPAESKKWTQPNQGDMQGILWETFNMDLNLRKGKIRLSQRLNVRMDSDDDADLQYPTAAVKHIYNALLPSDSKSVAAQGTNPGPLFFKPDGMKMYVLQQSDHKVYEYDLSTAWDISTATFLQSYDFFTSGGGVTGIRGMYFRYDGLKVYIQSQVLDQIREYNLSTAWDVSTITYLQNFSTAGQDGDGGKIYFSPNGSLAFLLGNTTNILYKYVLGTPWNITTAAVVQTRDFSSDDSDMRGVTFTSDGSSMYLLGIVNDLIFEYFLGSPWDISSAVLSQTFSVSSQDNTMQGIYLREVGGVADTYIFTTGNQNDSVFKYFLVTTPRWWVLANTAIFKSTNEDATAFTQETISVPLADLDHINSDLAEHERRLWATTTMGLINTVAGTWQFYTAGGDFLRGGIPHSMHVYNRLLLIGNGNQVHQVDRNQTFTNSRIIFPPEYEVRCIRSTPNRVWFALKNTLGGKGAVGEWDGFSDSYLNIYEVEGDIPFALVVKDAVPYVITNAGILFKQNGSAFSAEAYLPVFSEDMYQNSPSVRVAAQWKDEFTDQFCVSANGMEVIDDMIHIQLAGSIEGNSDYIFENMPSGIWCFDPDIGLYHRYSFSKYKTTDTVKDYGTSVIERPGFLVRFPNDNGLFLAGSAIHTNAAGTLLHIIASKDTAEAFTTPKRGNFITTQIHTSDVQEMWDKLWAKYRKFRDSDTKIALKIRSGMDDNFNFPFDATITWVSGTSFTSTDANFANVVAGNEIFVTAGDGAGASAHVATISLLTGTYTVTLDESVGTVTAATTARIRANNWRRFKTLDSSLLTSTNNDMALNETSNWVQLKVELRGVKDDPELHELIISTKGNIKGTV